MKKLTSLQLLLLVALLMTGCGQDASQNELVKGSIVGGERVKNFQEFPFIVSLSGVFVKDIKDPSSYRPVRGYCGGTLIAPQWVVTAAHCMGVIPTHITTGALSKSGFKVVARVEKVIVHPSFAVTEIGLPLNDITLIKIERKPELEALDFEKIALDDPSSTVALPGTVAKVMGWGAKCEDAFCQMATPDKLHGVEVPIVEDSAAMEKESYGENFDENIMIAAGYIEGGRDACQGDSGGPLFVKDGDRTVLIGVVSAGAGCARENFYGLYAKVSTYEEWIKAIMENDGEVLEETSEADDVVITESNAQ